MHDVANIVRIHGNMLETRFASAWVNASNHFDLDFVKGNLPTRRLNQEDVGDARPEHAELQLGRARSQVVAGEIGWAVADHLVTTNTDSTHTATALCGNHCEI